MKTVYYLINMAPNTFEIYQTGSFESAQCMTKNNEDNRNAFGDVGPFEPICI